MHNHRVPLRPLFGRKNARYGFSVQRIRAQAIDGLGRHRHQPSAAQNSCRLVQRPSGFGRLQMLRVHNQSQCFHTSIVVLRPAPVACSILTAMPIETEIKFRVDDLAGLARRLESAGFTLQTPRAFESNILYDTPDRQMRARTEILRIRNYAGRCLLTHKRLPEIGPGEDRHKHRIETETEVADGEALAGIFLSLGLVPAFRYEKWRAEWTDGEGHCVVDETPIGNYAELEGPAAWIDRSAARLGIDPAQYSTLSYGRLFELWRDQHHSAAQNLTFNEVAQAG
jgi:adenylate cyclase class 2